MYILVSTPFGFITGELEWITLYAFNFFTSWTRILVCILDPLLTQKIQPSQFFLYSFYLSSTYTHTIIVHKHNPFFAFLSLFHTHTLTKTKLIYTSLFLSFLFEIHVHSQKYSWLMPPTFFLSFLFIIHTVTK